MQVKKSEWRVVQVYSEGFAMRRVAFVLNDSVLSMNPVVVTIRQTGWLPGKYTLGDLLPETAPTAMHRPDVIITSEAIDWEDMGKIHDCLDVAETVAKEWAKEGE